MIPRECKRLAEVDFPIAVVSKHALREKSIRHGHPSTLHLWWARRPLGSCRAMLLALLLPDPCDEHCPEEFKERARDILQPIPGRVGATDLELREALLHFIGDFADWKHSANPTFLETGHSLVHAAHPDETPLVVDPFAGGGSIPLEALRLGCDAFASDLTPVACLILKVMLEDIPRHGPGLADELRRVGAEIKAAAEKELARFYPPDPDGARPIAYLWARTVRCEASNCGAEIPLVRSLWLCKKSDSRIALRYRIERLGNQPPRAVFEVFSPRTDAEVARGNLNNARATRLSCATTMDRDRIRVQLQQQRGGADVIFDETGGRIGGPLILAVVTQDPGLHRRQYRPAMMHDYLAVRAAQVALSNGLSPPNQKNLSAIPDEPVVQSKVAKNSPFRFHLYGFKNFGEVSTARQKVALAEMCAQVRACAADPHVRLLLSIVVNRLANACTALCRWDNTRESLQGMFTRQAISMVWDFCENAPLGEATGGFDAAVEWVDSVVTNLASSRLSIGNTEQLDAAVSPLGDESSQLWFTDPPYYDAVSYADLSDFFFVWLKRTHPHPDRLCDRSDPSNSLTPKLAEAIQDDTKLVNGRPKDRAFLEEAMARAFAEGRRVSRADGVGSVIFAHKTTEGWEALLSGMIKGGWLITGSWPIATEAANRLRARDSAALATSVHLVCRPRPSGASVGDWANVLGELPIRVGEWMPRLEREGVRGADLVFACIGPALEIFSRYSRVETAEGDEVKLPQYLQKVWEVVGRTALAQVLGNAEAQASDGSAGALEEDARLTALFLWTHRSTLGNGAQANGAEEDEEETDEEDDEENAGSRKAAKGFTLIFDIVRRFAQPLGIHLDVWEGRIIETKKGIVRLLPVSERARQLFGSAEVAGRADRIERTPPAARQLELFPELREAEETRPRGRRRRFSAPAAHSVVVQATTLDRVHTAMLLQASGRTTGLRNLLAAEQQRGPDFFRLSQSLIPLYPEGHEERRLLEAMLLAMPR